MSNKLVIHTVDKKITYDKYNEDYTFDLDQHNNIDIRKLVPLSTMKEGKPVPYTHLVRPGAGHVATIKNWERLEIIKDETD